MASAWIEQIFSSKALDDGKPVRRAISSVGKYASEAELIAACKNRGLMVVKTATQYIISRKGSFEILE